MNITAYVTSPSGIWIEIDSRAHETPRSVKKSTSVFWMKAIIYPTVKMQRFTGGDIEISNRVLSHSAIK